MAGGILTGKKWLLILLAIFLIAITLKSASAVNLQNGLVHYYTFDTANSSNPGGNPTMVDWYRTANVTDSVNTPTWNQTGISNESWDYEYTNSEYSRIKANAGFNQIIKSACAWIRLDNQNCPDANDCHIWSGDDSQTGWWFRVDATEHIEIAMASSMANPSVTGATQLNKNKWYHVCWTVSGNNFYVYVNGTQDGTTNSASPHDFKQNNNRIGANGGGVREWDGLLDEIGFWNRTLNTTELSALNKTGWAGNFTWIKGGAGPAPPVDDLNLSPNINAYPKSQYNSNPVSLWTTANARASWTCRLYINGTVNQTQTLGTGTNVNCSFNTNFTVGTWNAFIRGNTTNVDENTTTATIYFDDVSPVITPITWTNGTLRYTTNLTGSWNITDNFFLFRVNVSIDGNQFFGVTEINATQYTYNLNRNVQNLTPGNHTLTIQVADGHTALSIPDYDWYNGLFNDYLQYETGKAIIRIDAVDGSIWDSFTSTKEKDRYTFDYEPYDTKKTTYSFEVTSDKVIHKARAPTSEISQWLIIGDHWLDFYIPGTTVDITRIDKYTARVDVAGIKDKSKLSFSSIGDLNIVTRNYTFATTNMSVTYSQFINELETNTILLRINTTGTVTGTNAALLWNGTYQTVTKTINAQHDLYNATFLTPIIPTGTQLINFTWFYNVTGTINNLTGNITNNQTIIQIGIDNCSTFTTRAVNISLRDESNDSLVVGSINGYFEVWISSLAAFRAFNLTWRGNSTYGICINNASANYTTNSQMEYWNPTHDTKNYYMRNYTLDNVTDILDLYLTKNTTQVTLRVSDYDDDPIQDVYIHIQSYDLGTNSYKTTEIVRTDFQGRALAEMILYTQWYQFMLVYQGQTVLQTDATKLTSTTLNFQIDLGSNPVDTYNRVQNMVCSISFNNATNNFRMDFTNPSGLPILATLDVYNSTTYITNLLNSSSLTSASGTILINIGTPRNETYTGKGFVTINGNRYSCGNPQSVTFGADYLTWGLQGIFFTILVCIFLVCVGIWSPAISVLLLIIAIIITNLFGMFHLNTPYLITFIILGGITLYRLARSRV